jgi:DNA gyrase subunit A
MVALNGGKPEMMTLKDMLAAFVSFREEVDHPADQVPARKARDRAHVLVGLAIAVANIDEVITDPRCAGPGDGARAADDRRWPAKDMAPLIRLIDDPRHQLDDDGTYKLSEEQARAILDLRLAAPDRAWARRDRRRTGTRSARRSRDYLEILRLARRVQEIIKDELIAVRDEFGTPRRTEIAEGGPDMDDEDLIAREDMVVTVSA